MTIVAIVVAAVLLVLLLLDVVCYLRFHWGFLFCLRHSLCAGSDSKGKGAAVADDGKSRLKDGKHDLKFEPADKNHSMKGSKSSISKDSMV